MVDTLITLYEYDTLGFPPSHNGLGNLNDASKCEVTEELNGAFELVMEYPVTGIHYEEIQLNRILYTKTNIDGEKHAFRIYAISKPIRGIVTVNAEHISYDLSYIVVDHFEAQNSQDAISGINGNLGGQSSCMPAGSTHPDFTIWSDIEQEKDMIVKNAASKRSLLCGNSGSFVDIFGGEIKYSNGGTRIDINTTRGLNHGVVIEYGKNLTDVEQEENCASVYDYVCPTYYYYNKWTEKVDRGGVEVEEEREEKKYVNGYILPVNNKFVWDSDDTTHLGYLQSVKAQYPQFTWTMDDSPGADDCRYKIAMSDLHYMTDYGFWQFADSNERVNLAMGIRLDTGVTNPRFKIVLYDSDGNYVTETSVNNITSDWNRKQAYGTGCKIKFEYDSSLITQGAYVYIKFPTIGKVGKNTKVLSYDVSSEWNNTHQWSKDFPSIDEVNLLALDYISKNELDKPAINLTVSFELLAQTLEYKDYSSYEKVNLGDTVTVRFAKMGIDATARCVKTVYNVLTDKYSSIELGEGKSDFAYKTVESRNEVKEEFIENSNFLNEAFNNATNMINGNTGGYVVLHDTDGDGKPDEILIMAKPKITDSPNPMWRWNNAGLAFSPTGYSGPFNSVAITNDGKISADAILAGHMQANRIQGGTLTLGGFDNVSGDFQLNDASNKKVIDMTKEGLKLYATDGTTIKIKMDHDGLCFYNSNNEPVAVQIGTDGKIIAGSVAAENITGNTISGINMHLGNNSDSNGQLIVYDSNNSALVVLDHLGLRFKDSNGNWHVTEVNANGIKAGSVDAENITGTTISGKRIIGSILHSEDENGEYTEISGGYIQATKTCHFAGIGAKFLTFMSAENTESVIEHWWAPGQSSVLPTWKESLSFTGNGEVQCSGKLSGQSLQVLNPGTSTAAANCRLTTLDSQGQGTAGLVWYDSSSSIKYKHDFATKFDEELDPHKLYDIKVYQYKFQTNYIENKNDIRYDTNVIGFIAEQVDNAYPIAVDWHKDPKTDKRVVEDWNEKFIIPPMLKLIQEQHDEIESLKEQVNDILKLLKKE